MKRKLIITILLISTLLSTSACGGTTTVSETGDTSKVDMSESQAQTETESQFETKTALQMTQKMFAEKFSDVSVSDAVTNAGKILYVTAGEKEDSSNVAELLSSLKGNTWFDYNFVLFTQFFNDKPTVSVMSEFNPELKLSNMLWYDDNGNMIQNMESESSSQTESVAAPNEQRSVSDTKVETEQKKSEAPQISMEQSNALSKANDYLSLTAFSHSGLIKQLEYEGFSNESATYAADNCGADWNEQAASKAKSYLDLTSFSRSGLIDQLQYEGFTAEQAEYGATANGY